MYKGLGSWGHVPIEELIQECMNSFKPPGKLILPKWQKAGRNEMCPCGSDKKYKKCHLSEDEEARPSDKESPYQGAHEVCGKSKSGKSLKVWAKSGYWECGSCGKKGRHVDALVSFGKIGDVFIDGRSDAIEWLKRNYGESSVEWSLPIPFKPIHGREWPPGILPPVAEQWAQELSRHLQAPLALSASVLLGCVSAAATPNARIRVGITWWDPEPLCLWIMPVLASGEKKTPATKAGTKPLRDRQRVLREEAAPKIAEALTIESILKAELDKAMKEAVASKDFSMDSEVNQKAIQANKNLEAHKIPHDPRLLVDDATNQALELRMEENEGSIATISDEGNLIHVLTGRWSDGRLDFETYCKAWSNSPIMVDRMKRTLDIPNPRLAMLICIQPSVLWGMSKHKALMQRGFLPRTLFIVPETNVGNRTQPAHDVSAETKANYADMITKISALPSDTKTNEQIIKLTEEARKLFLEYQMKVERSLNRNLLGELSGSDSVVAFGAKLASQAIRIAGLMHLMENYKNLNAVALPVKAHTMQNAIVLAEYFKDHWLVAFGHINSNKETAHAKEIWDYIVRANLGPIFSVRDCHRQYRNNHKLSPSEVEASLYVLTTLGYLKRLPARDTGGAPSTEFEINPLALDPPDSDQNDQKPSTTDPSGPFGHDVEEVEVVEAEPETVTLPKLSVEYELIDNDDRLMEVVAELLKEEFVGIDLETTGLDLKTDSIRLVQLSSPSATYVIDAYKVKICNLADLLLSESVVKVGHNISFDAGFLYENTGLERHMMRNMFDTMLADKLIHGGKESRSLDKLAKEYLDVDLPDKEKFQKSSWGEILSKGQLEYAARDAYVLLPIMRHLRQRLTELKLDPVADLEFEAIAAVVKMKAIGVGFDKELWLSLAKDSNEEREAARRKLNEKAVELFPDKVVQGNLDDTPTIQITKNKLNWDSPQQKRQLLKEVGIVLKDTRFETLQAVQDKHTLVPFLLDYTSSIKNVTTFGAGWDGFKHFVDGRVHPDWNQSGAITGRMTCTQPNLQQIPRDGGHRKSFRADEGKVLVICDYSQVELRIVAEIADDKAMKQAFIDGDDLHTKTAQAITGKLEVTKDERNHGKAVNFGFVYGAGADGFIKATKQKYGIVMTEEKANSYREKWRAQYPGIRKWQIRQGKSYNSEKQTRTVLGRLGYPTSYTKALSNPIQGTAADGLKRAMTLLAKSKELVERCDSALIMAIHDELILEVKEDHAEVAMAELERCMIAGMSEFIKEVPITVSSRISKTYG